MDYIIVIWANEAGRALTLSSFTVALSWLLRPLSTGSFSNDMNWALGIPLSLAAMGIAMAGLLDVLARMVNNITFSVVEDGHRGMTMFGMILLSICTMLLSIRGESALEKQSKSVITLPRMKRISTIVCAFAPGAGAYGIAGTYLF